MAAIRYIMYVILTIVNFVHLSFNKINVKFILLLMNNIKRIRETYIFGLFLLLLQLGEHCRGRPVGNDLGNQSKEPSQPTVTLQMIFGDD